MRITLIGKGRLGLAIAKALETSGHGINGYAIEFARLDPDKGLVLAERTSVSTPIFIETAVFCLVPRHPEGGSGWLGLFDGLQKQTESKKIKIGRALFISSTAVYECIEFGWVDYQTPVHPVNSRTEGLLSAETAIRTLCEHTAVFRLTGLTGPGYHKYDPVSFSHDRPRQAVDIRAVAKVVAGYLSTGWQGHKTEVLTDGYIYYQGQILNPQAHINQLASLQTQYRLLRPSICARQDKSLN